MKKHFTKMKNPFFIGEEDWDGYDAFEYYVGIEGSTIEQVTCPEHVYQVLDRMHSMVMDAELEVEQENFLLTMLSDLMDEIAPSCREIPV